MTAAAQQETRMREAFEAWAKKEYPFIALGRVESGTYSSNKTRIMWFAWQAAQQQAVPVPSVLQMEIMADDYFKDSSIPQSNIFIRKACMLEGMSLLLAWQQQQREAR